MQVWIELYAQRALSIMDIHELALTVSLNDRMIDESMSKDEFGFFGTVLGGKRLAAIGRVRQYSYKDLFGIFEAEPAKPIDFLFIDPNDEIKLNIETNIWLDPGLMVQEVSLRIFSENKTLEIPLNRPDIRLDWSKRGTFAVDIGDFTRELNASRTGCR